MRKLKRVFTCYRILYLYRESLGLDITSVIFNRFKMAATYHFGDFFLSKNQTNDWFLRDTLVFNQKNFFNSTKPNLILIFETCSNWILFFLYRKICLRSCSNLLISTNLRFLPPTKKSIFYFLLELHPVPISITIQQKMRILMYNRTNDVEPRAPPLFYSIKKGGFLIHNRSCPSSRTLLSTTSFQTKFYHNIPWILNRYLVDSMMESWIVIAFAGT